MTSIKVTQERVMTGRRQVCRTCGGILTDFLDFGYMPLAGAFLDPVKDKIEYLYPMQISFCAECSLVQIPNVIPKEQLFNENYHYLSSVTKTLNVHFEGFADYLKELTRTWIDPLVLEFGCNDGVLLSKLSRRGIRNVGVDASLNVVEEARGKGLDVVHGFFTVPLAEEIGETCGKANIITGSNVFAHNDDVGEILRATHGLLASDGLFIVEVHYLVDLLRDLQFDFFYHEHCNYYSLHSLLFLLNKHGFEVIDVERLSMHSGSIRVISQRAGSRSQISPRVGELLRNEESFGITSIDTYRGFAGRMESLRKDLQKLLEGKIEHGSSICAYGASGRAVTMLNYFQFDQSLIRFILDASPLRANHLLPGLHIPILFSEKKLLSSTKACLITAWPYAEEIMKNEEWYTKEGGSFIIPLPKIREISA